jgi:hypothetical protein
MRFRGLDEFGWRIESRAAKKESTYGLHANGYPPFFIVSWYGGSSSFQLEYLRTHVMRRRIMLWTIFVVVLVLWLLGFSFHIGGGLIHLLLVVALFILVFNLITGRRRVL